MRIGMFSDTWLPTIDGVVTSLLPVRAELARRGHEVYVFAPGDEEAIEANKNPNVILSKGRDFRAYPEYHISLARMKIRKLVRERRVDIVHSHGVALMGMRAVWAARTNNLPLVFTYHTRVDEAAGYIARPGRPREIMRRLITKHVNWYLRRCDVVIAPSRATADHILETSGGNVRQMEVVPNGVDLTRFPETPSKAILARLGINEKTPTLLTVGRIAKEKSLETVIRSAPAILRNVPDARFVIVGKGPAREEVEKEVANAGLSDRFVFTGYLDDADVAGLYAHASAFLMPSRLETQGMVVLEAMRYGLVPVCADAGGVRDYVEHGRNGFLYAPGDSEALAEGVAKALAAGAPVSQSARETARRFSVEGAVDRLLALYGEAVAKGRGHSRLRAASKA